MGDHLAQMGHMEEAEAYYQKYLESSEVIYQQTGTITSLRDVIIALAKLGDNQHARGNYDEARAHHLKAMELAEQYIKVDPSAEELITYFRDKAMHSGTEE